MPRFVLLYHECPPGYVKPSHWDLMLEHEGMLWTWELRSLPAAWTGNQSAAGEVLQATRLADHRAEYINYEGPVSGDRGSVSRIMSGEFEWLENTPERIKVRLESDAYSGEILLIATSQRGHWQLAMVS